MDKTTFKALEKDEIINLSNTKTLLNNSEQGVKRIINNHESQRHSSNVENNEHYLGSSRQRKIKKHGINSFINFPTLRERKPNIILILTDDQDVELGSLNFMPKTLKLLRDGGAEFRHAYVTTPMCCPSRSSLLTGMYVHNHNVFTNNENCSSINWQQTHETRTFATYLSNAGYRTGYFGKYLNKYNGSYIPPGWREWGGLIMNSRYYNYSINLNGKKIKHGFDYSKDYYPDLIANDSIAFLRQSKQYFSRKPVMLVVSFPAPHGPEDSAPQYSKMFFNVTTHHTPSYDFAPNLDKQWILRVTNKMQDIHKQFTDTLMTKRLQTLQSVDSAVERIYQELKNIGELENTYILYTSDHGYHLGQFGLVKGKSFPFEFDIRVPFLVRGPGVEAGSIVDDIVLNIDLAPTFLDLAGVEPPPEMDGRSITRLFNYKTNKRRKIKWPDTFLIESSGRREIPDPFGLKKSKNQLSKKMYIESDSQEDISKDFSKIDKESLESTAEETSEEENFSFSSKLHNNSKGSTIVSTTSTDSQKDNKIPKMTLTNDQLLPKFDRLALECQNSKFQNPCQMGQKWYCVIEDGRWRKFKCKFQKKCACFTSNGFGIKQMQNNKFENQREATIVKRSIDIIDSWDQIINNDFSWPVLHRLVNRSNKVMKKKRSIQKEHISDILDDLELELYEAEETKHSINATYIFGQEQNVSKCLVTSQGKVNCSSLLYKDFNIWKKSRDEIEAKIKNLKTELETLKEIRKHLRKKRPEYNSTTVQPFTLDTTSTDESHNNNNNNNNFVTEVTSESYKFVETILNTTTTSSTKDFKEIVATTPKNDDENISTSSTTLSSKKPSNEVVTINNENNDNNSKKKINTGDSAVNRVKDICICPPDNHQLQSKKNSGNDLEKQNKRKLKEERLRKKQRKLRKKARLEKECLSERMNCFIHDNDHWKTPPFWTEGSFCFCMNANNNTYSCLRTINSTHNFLYCEFTTGFKSFYNLRIDPFEQTNRISTLSTDESRFLTDQLAEMKACKGSRECASGNIRENVYPHPNVA
ncbi:sulfatase-1, sulf-1, putative [Pediculus humanus corporis]|uniref:Sulfatase-1, sulf-1, putative n=1 Tax=Pediculus humanus subsp. corporis TaxID=121224 RepID=E0VBW9_PEDHC|nr:sulfatase-1, sulf-1, putative [Pediculus humanus corporis]EEB10875.1 sulfatase-1, sulf-1, putative [Pediculus humanus corporis]